MALLAGSIGLACASCATDGAGAPVLSTVMVSRAIPETAKKPCDPPVALPDRALGAAETTNFWGRDRAALRTCEARRKAAIEGTEP